MALGHERGTCHRCRRLLGGPDAGGSWLAGCCGAETSACSNTLMPRSRSAGSWRRSGRTLSCSLWTRARSLISSGPAEGYCLRWLWSHALRFGLINSRFGPCRRRWRTCIASQSAELHQVTLTIWRESPIGSSVADDPFPVGLLDEAKSDQLDFDCLEVI